MNLITNVCITKHGVIYNKNARNLHLYSLITRMTSQLMCICHYPHSYLISVFK